ncbi:hypothetical protein GCM10027085_65310 [Spirosoma aerophilum]
MKIISRQPLTTSALITSIEQAVDELVHQRVFYLEFTTLVDTKPLIHQAYEIRSNHYRCHTRQVSRSALRL